MGKINRFEDLIAWQKSRELCKNIYRITKAEPFAKDFGLIKQIRGAAVSAMSNIAEGFERGRKAEFHQFLSIAKGSNGEVRSQLYVVLDSEYISETEFEFLLQITEEAGRVINGLRASIEQNANAGF